jgi:hypothetical protein
MMPDDTNLKTFYHKLVAKMMNLVFKYIIFVAFYITFSSATKCLSSTP